MLVICFFVGVAIIHPETASIAPGTSATTNSESEMQIASGQLISRDLAAGLNDKFLISIEQGKLLRFSIDKGDLALSTRLYGPDGAKLLEHVSQDFEVVDISYPIQLAGTYRIELQSREQAAAHRHYELKVFDLKTVTALGQKDSEARQAMARAEVLRANWTEHSLRQARTEYDMAASIWTSISDFASASHATLKAGNVYFLLSEYAEALKRYQYAEKLATREWLAKARALSQMARLYSFRGDNDLAQKQLNKALRLFKQNDSHLSETATNVYGEVLSTLAEVTYAKGDLLKSTRQFESAGKALRNDRKGQANVHLFTSFIAGSSGDRDNALAAVFSALELYRAINHKTGEGLALAALGLAHSYEKDESGAIELHREALKIFSAAGDRHSQAIAHNALGQAFENLTEYDIALFNYDKALRLFQDIDALDGVTMTTFKIANVHLKNNRLDQALTYFERCLSLSRTAGKLRTETIALNDIAKVYAAKGLHELALKDFQKVLTFYKASGDRRGQVTALNARGDVLLQLGQKERALDVYTRALSLSEKVGDKGLVLTSLYNLARAHYELGSLDAALRWVQRSISMIEDLRTNVASPEFRASYFSGARKHYELCIAIFMRLDRARPREDFAAQALSVSEKSRARLLLDVLRESQVRLRHRASAELVNRERKLRDRVQTMAKYELDRSSEKRNSSELAEVTKQLAELRSEYQEIQAKLRGHNPHLAALERFEPLGVKEIQNELRNTDTLLLQYSLGEKQSYLWAVAADSFSSYELPSRKIIEDAATEVYQLLIARQGAEGQSYKEYQAKVEAADRLYPEKSKLLSEMLLGPVAEQLGTRRVLVVAEGALQHIPFDALPALQGHLVAADSGGRPSRLLVETNEIVGSPSISVLSVIRAEKNYSHSPNRVVAVIADPVFSRNDERVQSDGSSSAIASAAASTQPENTSVAQVFRDPAGNNGPARLFHSSEEADAISAAAPRGTTMMAKGFEATRETAMSPRLGEYQIVHFATHGRFDSRHPELSGIVLTMVDRAGGEKNGVMPLHDIYSLDLSAELTVLSACETALGKDVRGEGLVGLTHSFMSAGSKTVVASLWKVDDRATAKLMADFYHAMLQEGMPTGAALRAAKLKMMQDKHWHAPYFWAGFVLQGEYTNEIAVARSSTFSIRTTILLLLAPVLSGLIFLYWRRGRLARVRRV